MSDEAFEQMALAVDSLIHAVGRATVPASPSDLAMAVAEARMHLTAAREAMAVPDVFITPVTT